MRHPIVTSIRKAAVVASLVGLLPVSNGCATLAHRSSYDYEGKQTVTACASKNEVCPWLIGDALLLIPGVIPGVIAFCVDFGTGAWHHYPGHHDDSATSVRTAIY